MAWLFPSRDAPLHERRLEEAMAAHLASTEVLSRTAHDAKATAETEARQARAIVSAARERLAKQEQRRISRRQTLEHVLARDL